MASWNFFREGITPLSKHDKGRDGFSSSDNSRKRSSKKKYKWDAETPRESLPPMFRNTIEEIHKILKVGVVINERDINKVKVLLDSCYMDDPVCTYMDDYGYDIVQKSVAAGAIQLLEYLVSNNYDLRLNSRSCSSALYLACKSQDATMVKFLLNQGAYMYQPSKCCYPKRHNMSGKHQNACSLISHEAYVKHLRHRTPFTLEERKCTPLYTAIRQDRKDIVDVLLDHHSECEDGTALLEYACRIGAVKCMGSIIRVSLKLLRNEQCVSLMHFLSAAFSHSEQCGVAFFEEACNCGIKNKVLQAFCTMENRNLLHVIYREPTVHYFDITKKVVSAGFDCKNINQPDAFGNTPLHALVSKIALQASCNNPPSRNSHARGSQNAAIAEEERQEQLFATVQYLISLGADVTMVNNPGETVLHILINSISYPGLAGHEESAYEAAVLKIQPKINRLLEYFLRKCVDVNHCSFHVSTVLSQLINNLSMFTASSLDTVWVHMWYTFNLLFKYDADPNIIDSRGISSVSMVLTTLHRWLQLGSSRANKGADGDLPCRVLEKVKDLLWLMFRHGLKPSDDVLQLSVKQVSIMCNITIGDDMFLTMVKDLLVPFICHGVNPNKLDVIFDGENNIGVPCRLHAQFYITRAFIVYNNQPGSILPFFQIFINTLEQDKLNILLKGIHKTLQENFENTLIQQTACLKLVVDLKQEVRSLKCLSRIAIANALQWRLYEKKTFLPLPKIIQQYLCDL